MRMIKAPVLTQPPMVKRQERLTEIYYPESDGKPVGETGFHIAALFHLWQALRFHYRNDPNVYVAGNMLFYYEEGNPAEFKAPDIFVVKGIAKHDRRVYKLWEEAWERDALVRDKNGVFADAFDTAALRLSGACGHGRQSGVSVLAVRRASRYRVRVCALPLDADRPEHGLPVPYGTGRLTGEKVMKKILDIARVVRSKNSGPYELVLDIMLKNRELFDALRASGQFSAERVAAVYGVELAEIRNIVWFEPANAVKVVMPRRIVSGAPGDSDVYGAQQHAPLLSMEFDL